MSKLHRNPARPRQSGPHPRYPRRLGLGAAVLLAAAAASAGGCINSVEVPGDAEGDGPAIHLPDHIVVPAQGGSAGWEETGGNFAGGIGDDWEDYPSDGGGGGYDSGAGGAG